MVTSYYQNEIKVMYSIYEAKKLQQNLQEVIRANNSVILDILDHIEHITKNISNIEVLLNLDYHGMIWNYLYMSTSYVNGCYQELVNLLFLKREFWKRGNSKLNNLSSLNKIFYMALNEYIKIKYNIKEV